MSDIPTQVTIASIVEGDGEVQALPALLRRIAADLSVWNIRTLTPHRIGRAKLVAPGGVESAVAAQARRLDGPGGILILLDADDDCPAELGPRLLGRARRERADANLAVVLATESTRAGFSLLLHHWPVRVASGNLSTRHPSQRRSVVRRSGCRTA